jgi:hypothetical protein
VAKSTFEDFYYKTPKVDEKEVGLKDVNERKSAQLEV